MQVHTKPPLLACRAAVAAACGLQRTGTHAVAWHCASADAVEFGSGRAAAAAAPAAAPGALALRAWSLPRFVLAPAPRCGFDITHRHRHRSTRGRHGRCLATAGSDMVLLCAMAQCVAATHVHEPPTAEGTVCMLVRTSMSLYVDWIERYAN